MAIKFSKKSSRSSESSKQSSKPTKEKNNFGCCAPGGLCAPGGGRKYINREKDQEVETIEDRNLSFTFNEEYGMDIHGQRRELAEILREITLIEESNIDDRGLMNIISEQNDANESVDKLNRELRQVCDQLTHVQSSIRSRETETIEIEKEIISVEKTERERYDICWTHVHKYSRDSNEMMLQLSYNEVVYSTLRQYIEDLTTELNTIIMSGMDININISETYTVELMEINKNLALIRKQISDAKQIKQSVENAKTLYNDELKETAMLKKQIEELKAKIAKQRNSTVKKNTASDEMEALKKSIAQMENVLANYKTEKKETNVENVIKV